MPRNDEQKICPRDGSRQQAGGTEGSSKCRLGGKQMSPFFHHMEHLHAIHANVQRDLRLKSIHYIRC